MKNRLGLWIGILLILDGFSGCAKESPADFRMIVDCNRSESIEESPTEHVYLEFTPDGRYRYIIYDTGGSITHDPEGMLVISAEQIIRSGSRKIVNDEMERLWQSIEDNKFFGLTEDYRMSIGGAYAYLVVSANGQTHSVDNIGMDVLRIKRIIDTLNELLPDDLALEYSWEGPW